MPKTDQKERDWGYSLGGPVGKPGGNNKLFFFYSHEYRPRTSGDAGQPVPRADRCSSAPATSRSRTDQNGNLPIIRDTWPICTGDRTRGCFPGNGDPGRSRCISPAWRS